MRVGRKILVRRSEFDRWLEAHQVKHLDVGCIVDELVAGSKGEKLMSVKVRKKGKISGTWSLTHQGRRKSKCVGSREAAESVKRQVEAKLALGDLCVLDAAEDKKPTFNAYADGWLKDYARIECKTRPLTAMKEFSTSICDRGSAKGYSMKSGGTISSL